MWEELGISGGTGLIVLIAFYFVIKWAVKNAIRESRPDISRAVKKGIEKYYEDEEGSGAEEPDALELPEDCPEDAETGEKGI